MSIVECFPLLILEYQFFTLVLQNILELEHTPNLLQTTSATRFGTFVIRQARVFCHIELSFLLLLVEKFEFL